MQNIPKSSVFQRPQPNFKNEFDQFFIANFLRLLVSFHKIKKK